MNTGGYLVPFVVVFAFCCAMFLALDIGVMNLQGLSLMYHG